MNRQTQTLLIAAGAVALLWVALRQKERRDIFTNSAGDSPSLIDRLTAEAVAIMPKASTVPVRQITQSTLAFLRQEEGYSETPYNDAGGYSVGYGHYLGTTPAGVTKITRDQAESWLLTDASKAAKVIQRYVRVPLTQNQFDALVSWLYNVGEGNLLTSTLLKRLNAGDYAGAATEFAKWIYSQKVILPALVARRNRERMLFLKP